MDELYLAHFLNITHHQQTSYMSHNKKAKAAGVSASSFLDLKSELAKQESEFAKNKSSGKSYVVGGSQRPEKVSSLLCELLSS